MSRAQLGNTTIVTYPIDGSDVSSAPTNKIPASSMQHAYLLDNNLGFKLGETVATKEVVLHVANGNETIQSFSCGCVDTGSAASVTFDLKKNGASILASAVTVTNADADRTKKIGTVSSPSLVDNDVLTVLITVSSATGMSGPFVQVPVIAAASPV